VFKAIQENVNDYSDTVGQSLNSILGEYVSSLKEFSNRLTTAASNLGVCRTEIV
jgi:hypothetical protein